MQKRMFLCKKMILTKKIRLFYLIKNRRGSQNIFLNFLCKKLHFFAKKLILYAKNYIFYKF